MRIDKADLRRLIDLAELASPTLRDEEGEDDAAIKRAIRLLAEAEAADLELKLDDDRMCPPRPALTGPGTPRERYWMGDQ